MEQETVQAAQTKPLSLLSYPLPSLPISLFVLLLLETNRTNTITPTPNSAQHIRTRPHPPSAAGRASSVSSVSSEIPRLGSRQPSPPPSYLLLPLPFPTRQEHVPRISMSCPCPYPYPITFSGPHASSPLASKTPVSVREVQRLSHFPPSIFISSCFSGTGGWIFDRL